VEQRSARPRIADVAREAGVSKTAVSFAFNSPDRLAPGTAERIRLVAERLGYRPHPVARMLSQRETLTIGVLTPQELEHRQVVVIGVEPPAPIAARLPSGVMARRLAGYRAAFAAVGAEIPDARVLVGPASIEGGMSALESALAVAQPFTGILAMSDAMAIGAMRMLHDRGMAVPRDVSVVGFDDIDLARHVDPALTTVHQPIRRKGEEAVDLLLATIRGGGSDATEHRRLDARLIVRESTGPVRRGRA